MRPAAAMMFFAVGVLDGFGSIADSAPARGPSDGGSNSNERNAPAQCYKDVDPAGDYDLVLTSVPIEASKGFLPPQCKGAPTGDTLEVAYRVMTNLETGSIKVSRGKGAIIRDAKLERSVSDVCRAHGVTEPRVTWFSWKEYASAKDGWSWTTTGFGAGDATSSNILRRISLIMWLTDDHGTPVCYLKFDSEDS